MQMDIMTFEHLHTIGDQSKWHKGEPTALAKLIWRLIQAPLIMCNKEHKLNTDETSSVKATSVFQMIGM